jgi:hypothetical protein
MRVLLTHKEAECSDVSPGREIRVVHIFEMPYRHGRKWYYWPRAYQKLVYSIIDFQKKAITVHTKVKPAFDPVACLVI